MLKKIILWVAVIALSVRIFGFSAATGKQSEGTSEKITKVILQMLGHETTNISEDTPEYKFFQMCHKIVRKAAHFFLYSVLAVLTLFLAKSYRLNILVSSVVSALYCLLFAIGDEIHQLFVDGRSGQIGDVFIDFGGALFGIGIVILMYHMMHRKSVCK